MFPGLFGYAWLGGVGAGTGDLAPSMLVASADALGSRPMYLPWVIGIAYWWLTRVATSVLLFLFQHTDFRLHTRLHCCIALAGY